MTAEGLLDLARRAAGAARPGEDVEAYAQWGRQTSVRSYEEAPEQLTSAESLGLGVRVIAGGRLGYAYAADPDPGEVGDLVAAARENAAGATPDEGNVLPAPEEIEPLAGLEAPGLEALSPAEKAGIAVELERLVRAADPRIRTVRMCDYREVLTRTAVAATTGLEAEANAGICYVLSVALAGDDGDTQTGHGVSFARDPGELDVAGAATEAARRATRLLGARKPSTERLPVVLDPWTVGDLLGVIAGGLSGDAVLKGRSLFADKVGERVASDAVVITDEGRDPRSLGAFPFDDEGLPTRRTPLIDGGVLQGFLHNAYTAARTGGRSTANASRPGFQGAPGVSPHCLVVRPGADGVDALLSRLDRALYVQELVGVHSGANPITGDFSVGVTGFIVERGAPAEPVREATIASTLLDILSGVESVASDLVYLPGSAAAPTIVIGEMTVGGT